MTKEIWYELAAIIFLTNMPLFEWISPIGANLAYITKCKAALGSLRTFVSATSKAAKVASSPDLFQAIFLEHILRTLSVG